MPIPRRTFLKTMGLASALAPVSLTGGHVEAADDANELGPLAKGLLSDWCEGLLRLQIDNPAKPDQHGAFRCPACGVLHGRCGDAVYPLLHAARVTGESKYVTAAIRVVDWMKNVDSPDGAWTNEPHAPTSWKGITVFGAIALGEAIRLHGDLLDKAVKERWRRRLRAAATFINDTFRMDYANINYPTTASYALTLMGTLFDEPKFTARGRAFAHGALEHLSQPNKLLFGEGHPQTRRSDKGLAPIDLGYNVEESLPALALYGLLAKDEEVLGTVTAALASHLEFMLPDGGWDNSWGTRNYKWTYWGSRTSDGCQPAYALLADRHPAFGAAALRNTQLLRACTADGLLHGGPHFRSQGVPPCVHHTFCHAKALATTLDHGKERPPVDTRGTLPREIARGVRGFPELDTILVARGPWRATVSGYDWLYEKDLSSGMGGALSMLWHRDLGPLLTSSLANYRLVEANNMQPQPGPDFCLTARVEARVGQRWFSNILDPTATIRHTATGSRTECFVAARLLDVNRAADDHPAICRLHYTFSDEAVTISAQVEGVKTSPTGFALVLPLISAKDEVIHRASATSVRVAKPGGAVLVEANTPLSIDAAGRVFNVVPGFAAIPFVLAVRPGRRTEVSIRHRHLG